MRFNKIELGQILSICIIILGFSLTLISFFKGKETLTPYLDIIFWLIILPFGIEAIIVTISNTFEKYRRLVDVFLIVCLISLVISLIILFSYDIFPEFISKYSNIIGIVTLSIIVLVMSIIDIIGSKHLSYMKSEIFKSFYKLEKRVNKKGNYIFYIVTVSDDIVLYTITAEMIKSWYGYGFRFYSISDVLRNEIVLTKENIAIITDSQNNLIEIVKGFEKNKNKVLGIITTFKLNKKQKSKLSSYNIEESLF